MSYSTPSKNIKDSKEKLQVIINHIRDIITESDLNGNFTYVSPQVYDILGYKPEELIGLNGLKFIHPEDLLNLVSKMKNLMKSGSPMLAEYRVLHKDGHYVHISANGTFVKENGNIKLIAVLRDISLQKETEEKYRFITENINDIISVFNDKFELLFINETQERISGLSKEEIMGKSPLEFLHPDDIKMATKTFRRTLRDGQGRGQFRMRSKDNLYKWMDANARVTSDSDGNQRILMVSRDITREKEIEKKLKESEQKYGLLAKNINDIIWTMDLNFNTTYVSPSVKSILGYTVQEDMARSITEKFTSESLKKVNEMIKQHITPKKIKDKNYNPVLRIEVDQYHNNGSIIPCEVTVNPMRDKNGVAFGLVGITRNIAKRKEAEQKLKESEEKYRLIAQNSQDIVYTLDMNLNNIYISPSVYNVLGYDVNEAILMNPRDTTHKEDFKKISRIYHEEFKLERKKGIKKDLNRKRLFNIREKHRDGRILTMEHTISWLRDENGIAVGILGVARDVTEKKNSEEALKESEEKYRTLFENSPYAVGLINLKGVVIQGNSNIEQIFGYRKEEFIGQSFSKFPLFSKEHNTIVLKSLNKLIKGEIPEPQELQLHRKDGSIIWVTMQPSIVKLKNETLFQVITQDISKIKEAELKLKESEEQFRSITEQSLMGIAVIQKGKLKYINKALESLTGFSIDELLNFSINDIIKIIAPGDLEYARELLDKNVISDLQPYTTGEFRLFTKNNEIKWVEHFTRKYLYKGKPANLVSIIDITEKKKAEEIIIEENKRLIELDKIRQDLMIRISHELKTPLTSIYGVFQVLLEKDKKNSNEEILPLLEIGYKGSLRLKELINNLLDSSKLDIGMIELRINKENLSRIVNDCIEELSYIAKSRNIILESEVLEEIYLEIDRLRLGQVIINIISNAIKNTPPNGSVFIHLTENQKYIDISVKDTGVGITDKEKKKLFQKFGKIERYGMGLELDIEGAGLGLYISKEIIELHGGQIIVESEGRKKGSNFIIRLLKNK